LAEFQKGQDRRVTSNILLTIITLFISGVILRLARSVIIPLLIAVFLSYLMDPLVTVLRKIRMPVILAALISGAIFLGAFFGFGYILYDNTLDFAKEIPTYQSALVEMLQDLVDRVQIATDNLFGLQILDELKKIPIGSVVLTTVGSIANFLAEFLLIFLFSLLILTGKYGATRKLLRSFPHKEAKKIAMVLLHIDRDLRKYVGIKGFVSAVIGLSSGVALALFHVEFAIVLGFLTFLLNFIPYLGSIFSVILPVIIVLVQFASLSKTFWILVVLIVMQNLVAQLLEPKLVGSRLRITIFVVFFAFFFWGWLWGAAGVLLAIPMTTSIKIVMEDIPGLRSFALLLEKPPARRFRRLKKKR